MVGGPARLWRMRVNDDSTPLSSSPPPPDRATDALRHESLGHIHRIDDLIDTIKETADKLSRDGTTRGDLKILSRTLRELRYAFKVFAPYRRRRKVSVFGS